MDRVFQVVAVIFAGIAAYFFWSDNKDGAFVSAVLGCVAFFLSIRAQVQQRRKQREGEELSHESAATENDNEEPHQGSPPPP